MTAPGILPEVLDGAAVGIFGILLSAAFCPIRWTDKKRHSISLPDWNKVLLLTNYKEQSRMIS